LQKNKFDCKVKIARSDNSLEFDLHQFYALKGILHKKNLVLKLPNKMGELRGNTNTFLMLEELFFFNLNFLKLFGLMLLCMPLI